ncbi:MAG: hypothetical protein HW380_1478 [Magnetococcales bacterium]|nr:hypothetical protein [Magnetococcales bacterium]HIJ84826.1 hypothetical protein [Magnetococcales bacterium]
MIAPVLGRHLSFVKGLVALYLIFLVIFFAAAPFLTLWLYAETDLSRSLLPQLIGFCLQGAFLVVVFAIYEKRTTIQAKRGHKFALRSAVASLIRPLDSDGGWVGKMMSSSPTILTQFQQDIMDRGFSGEQTKKLGQHARTILVSLESLTVLAAQIDVDHLEHWGLILNSIRELVDVESPKQARDGMMELIDAVRDFDELYIY